MKRLLHLAAALTLLVAGAAWAHAELETAQPEANTVVRAPLAQVKLNFTEPVELRFSIFKVYRLDPEATKGLDPAQPQAWQRLNGLAGALVSDVLTKDDPDAARVDTGPAGEEPQGKEVVLGLEPDLAPGFYVVMWRALAIDTHGTQDFYVFRYEPQPEPGN